MLQGDSPSNAIWAETLDRQHNATRWLANTIAQYMPGVPAYPTIGNHGIFTFVEEHGNLISRNWKFLKHKTSNCNLFPTMTHYFIKMRSTLSDFLNCPVKYQVQLVPLNLTNSLNLTICSGHTPLTPFVKSNHNSTPC